MFETAVVLTPLHYLYLIGVVAILLVMILRKDTPAICVGFLFLLGAVGLGSFIGGIQVIFKAILYASVQFMEIIATIAFVTALSKCLMEMGSDVILTIPMKKIMKTPSLTWWILGLTMMVFSFFLWPSPSVALVGAIVLPFALKMGFNPLAAAVAMNLFGHGIALSWDFVIQGAPAISAGAAGIDALDIIREGRPVFLAMSIVTVGSAFFLNRKELTIGTFKKEAKNTAEAKTPRKRGAMFLAVLTPTAFLADVILMTALHLSGGDATSVVSGTALLLTCIGAAVGFRKQSLERITNYITDGFLFAIKIFAPVIIIGAFFFLGGEGIGQIMGEKFAGAGLMNDWAVWLAQNAPLNKYMAAFLQLFVGGLTGLDGSGFSGLPLTGSLALTFGTAIDISIPVLAALGQIAAVFVGGGTIVPWGLVPVAAMCNVKPLDLARKNIVPVFLGFLAAFLVACVLL